MAKGYVYVVRLASTAQTTAKTLIQIKAGAAPIDIIRCEVGQVTKTTSELLSIQLLRKSAAATVTSATPLLVSSTTQPAALAIGGATSTGTNASAEGTDTDILYEEVWNILNGSWVFLPVPEERHRIPQAGFWGLKLATAPAASMSIEAVVTFEEVQ